MKREEGLTSIYRGLSPALVRQALYGTIKFGLYYSRYIVIDSFPLCMFLFSKDVAKRLVRQKESTLVNLCCAGTGTLIAKKTGAASDKIRIRS